jgi:hypothetical protein
MDENTNVFISYAHEDAIIANAIRDQLTLLAQSGKGGPSLNCFLDTESIQPGARYQPIIRAALEKADWLIVVFTGCQSVYCGYEIGMYSIIRPEPEKPMDKPVACLHDVDKRTLPAVVEGYNTTMISRVAPYLPDPPKELIPTDMDLWYNSPVSKLLRAICNSKSLYTPGHRANHPAQYEVDVAQAASKIAHSFEIARQEDEQSETPLQAGLEIIVPASFEGKEDERVPPQSTVLGASRAFEILGLIAPYSVGGNEAPHISWGELRQALSKPGRANIPWMDRLETNIRLAAAGKAPQPDDVTFRSSGQDRRIYRSVLTRFKLYQNGKRRFYVMLVETFDRRFVGDRDTSLLLTLLTLACRWRFTFFERWQETLKQFDSSLPDADFRDACRQFEYNVEWIENEGVELGADDLNAMVTAFGDQHKARVERFFSDYYTAKNKMTRLLPKTFENVSPEKRQEVQGAIVEFLTAVKGQNAEFLKLCVRSFAQKLEADE